MRRTSIPAFSVGRLPTNPIRIAHAKSLKGVRIGVVREYMDKSLFTKADEENIDLVNAAIEDCETWRRDRSSPGAGGLFTSYVRRYFPMLTTSPSQAQQGAVPVDAARQAGPMNQIRDAR